MFGSSRPAESAPAAAEAQPATAAPMYGNNQTGGATNCDDMSRQFTMCVEGSNGDVGACQYYLGTDGLDGIA